MNAPKRMIVDIEPRIDANRVEQHIRQATSDALLALWRDITGETNTPTPETVKALTEQRDAALKALDAALNALTAQRDDDTLEGQRRTADPFTFTPNEDGTLTIENVVAQALGAASVAWSRDDLGTFDTDRVMQIRAALLAEIERHTRTSQIIETTSSIDITPNTGVQTAPLDDDIEFEAPC